MLSKICSGSIVLSIAIFAFVGSYQTSETTIVGKNEGVESCQEDKAQTHQEQDRQKPKRVDETRLYMRAKLASSQRVMEGLVAENYDLIIDGAQQMKDISHASYWPKTVDEVYQHYSVEFQRQCDKLKSQAERRDLQAAHYTYLHLSTTCIDCHNYVRPRFEVKRSKKGGPIQLIPTQWDSRDPPVEDDGSDEEVEDKTG